MNQLNIRTGVKLGKFKAWLFSLVGLSSNKMIWFWFSVLFCQQMISASIEILVWGERFEHIGDSIAAFVIVSLYAYYQSELGKFMLKLILSENKEAN